MKRYLKEFTTQSDYENQIELMGTPHIVYIEDLGGTIYVKEKHGLDLSNMLQATYNVSSGNSTKLYNSDPSEISKMYIDGEEVSPTAQYTFSTDGDHTVHYSFVDSINIPKRAFMECPLTSVTIPNSVESIGVAAFGLCESLTSVTIPNSVTSIGNSAFSDCYSLKSVTIPNSVTSIGKSAFFDCYSLKLVSIPNSVTSIGNDAFRGCKGLTSIVVDEGNSVYDSRNNCNAIIETATNTLHLGCQTTVIPNSVTSIGVAAFQGCKDLISITLPEGVETIGDYAFYGCKGLTSLTIPEGVKTIGEEAFQNCSGLISIVVEEGNSVYDSREGCNALIETGTNTLLLGCNNSVIPNSVKSIGDNAFYWCDGLTSVTIGSGVTSIGVSAFAGCSNISNITCLAYLAPSLDTDVFSDVASSGILYVSSDATGYDAWLSNMPSGWTIEYSDEL